MIRIDPRRSGTAQPTRFRPANPFVGRAGRDEIFSYGLRNPFRWSFDLTGGRPRIAIADVGQSEFEELNFLTVADANGANFGWNRLEGYSEFNPPVPGGTLTPSFVLPHSDGYCSVIGGVVVTDRTVPALRGQYLFTDFCKKRDPQLHSTDRPHRVDPGHRPQRPPDLLIRPRGRRLGLDQLPRRSGLPAQAAVRTVKTARVGAAAPACCARVGGPVCDCGRRDAGLPPDCPG